MHQIAPSKYAIDHAPPDDAPFTREELARLETLCGRFDCQPEYLELDLDERRLIFARWLIDHGKLGESD